MERLGGDLPQTTMHTVVEPGLLALIGVFSPMLLPWLPDPLASGIKPELAGLATGSFPLKPSEARSPASQTPSLGSYIIA